MSTDKPTYGDYETTDGALLRSLSHEDREKIGELAEASGQKSSGVVRPAIEREIERREWRIKDFEHVGHAAEYYRAHRSMWDEYDRAILELSEEDPVYGPKVKQEFEMAGETLRDERRMHRAKAEAAARWLDEHSDLEVQHDEQHRRTVPELDEELGVSNNDGGER